jgi:hypothetical protein
VVDLQVIQCLRALRFRPVPGEVAHDVRRENALDREARIQGLA